MDKWLDDGTIIVHTEDSYILSAVTPGIVSNDLLQFSLNKAHCLREPACRQGSPASVCFYMLLLTLDGSSRHRVIQTLSTLSRYQQTGYGRGTADCQGNYLALLQHSQLGFHVNVFCLAGQGILQSLLIGTLDAQQQGPVGGEAMNESLKDLPVRIQNEVGTCKSGFALLLVCCLHPAACDCARLNPTKYNGEVQLPQWTKLSDGGNRGINNIKRLLVVRNNVCPLLAPQDAIVTDRAHAERPCTVCGGLGEPNLCRQRLRTLASCLMLELTRLMHMSNSPFAEACKDRVGIVANRDLIFFGKGEAERGQARGICKTHR